MSMFQGDTRGEEDYIVEEEKQNGIQRILRIGSIVLVMLTLAFTIDWIYSIPPGINYFPPAMVILASGLLISAIIGGWNCIRTLQLLAVVFGTGAVFSIMAWFDLAVILIGILLVASSLFIKEELSIGRWVITCLFRILYYRWYIMAAIVGYIICLYINYLISNYWL